MIVGVIVAVVPVVGAAEGFGVGSIAATPLKEGRVEVVLMVDQLEPVAGGREML